MKNILGIFVTIVIGAMTFTSCDPVNNREVMKGAVTEADVRAKVKIESIPFESEITPGKMVNSNYIRITSDGLAPCVTSFTHGLGTFYGTDIDSLQAFVVPGTFDVYVNVINADGTSLPPIAFPVTVDECFNVAPEWATFCGEGEKVWTWDPNADSQSRVWGNGGYLSDTQLAWWGQTAEDVNGQSNALNEGAGAFMTLSADGATLTKTKSDGSVVAGTFRFDMSKTKNSANDPSVLWSIGKFYTTGVTVLCGKAQNQGEGPVYEYDILKLDDNHLVLGWPETGDSEGAWGGCWYWLFKSE